MTRFSRIRDRLKVAAMTWFVRLLRLIVVVAEWWPTPSPNKPARHDDQRGGSIGSVGPP
ncbi:MULTISPECIES: hypothetical protein [unclassified Mycobacterium]|uniref:hypothetical protein n=1 Tax=unclassified Mycobacterium TaxID=2642494 RepID=UPI001486D6DE|nr:MULTISPECIES: hypothetical protein [unclassified Mycobacterium]MCG7607257.1 hypothetical protein [Mycobacterium sp. CnD-18-1]